jgi:hypothetical protein
MRKTCLGISIFFTVLLALAMFFRVFVEEKEKKTGSGGQASHQTSSGGAGTGSSKPRHATRGGTPKRPGLYAEYLDMLKGHKELIDEHFGFLKEHVARFGRWLKEGALDDAELPVRHPGEVFKLARAPKAFMDEREHLIEELRKGGNAYDPVLLVGAAHRRASFFLETLMEEDFSILSLEDKVARLKIKHPGDIVQRIRSDSEYTAATEEKEKKALELFLLNKELNSYMVYGSLLALSSLLLDFSASFDALRHGEKDALLKEFAKVLLSYKERLQHAFETASKSLDGLWRRYQASRSASK